MNLYEDEDDIFVGSPKSKFMDIVFNANRDLVHAELEYIVERMASLELLLEENGVEDVEKAVIQKNYTDADNVQTKAKSLYIELMGNILSQNE